jgi:hypothetical protein
LEVRIGFLQLIDIFLVHLLLVIVNYELELFGFLKGFDEIGYEIWVYENSFCLSLEEGHGESFLAEGGVGGYDRH